MRKYLIKELVKVNRGSSPRPIIDYLVDDGYRWLKISDFNMYDRFVFNTKEFIKEEGLKNTRHLPKGTLILTNSATPGIPIFLGQDMCLHDGFLYFSDIKNEIINVNYLYYWFLFNRNKIVNHANGSVFKNLKKEIVENFEIEVPNMERQLKIVGILDNINSKIENNNAISNNLINIINVNYLKYLSDLNDYEELKIKDMFEFETGVEPGSGNYLEQEEEETVKFYRVGDMDSECKTYIKKDKANGKLLNVDDVVVSFDATIGRIGYGLSGSYSTGMKKISVKDKYKNIINNSFIFAYFSNDEVKKKIMENARGTTILHASSSIDFLKFKYNEDIIKKYSNIISSSFENLKSVKFENEILCNLRNVLINKLIGGEITLKD